MEDNKLVNFEELSRLIVASSIISQSYDNDVDIETVKSIYNKNLANGKKSVKSDIL